MADHPATPPSLIEQDWCALHQVREPAHEDDTDDLWCGECWHWFPDAWALIAEYNWGLIELGHSPRVIIDPMKIFFCPLCLHDF